MAERHASCAAERRILVTASDGGQRLDVFLATAVGSRAQAQTLIDAGQVEVDGRARPKRHTVREGQEVVLRAAAAPAPEGEVPVAPYTIAYEDAELLVVDKPAGVVVHPARGHRSGTLAQALIAHGASGGEDPWRAGIVHRLDRDTSGLLVVAKSDEVHRRLKALLAKRALHREYLALVDGHPPARSGTIDAPIGRHRRQRLLMSIDTDEPRAARTHYATEQLLSGATLLRVILETGRTHQIRVHLAAIGHPVAGDPQYGVAGRFGLQRQFLHAARLAFRHPADGHDVDVRSALPEDLASALRRAQPPPA